jgi:hypothetical protein
VGRLSTTLSRNAWVSVSIQWQVLEHQQERLDLTLPQEQPFDPVERLLAALRGVKPLPLRVVDGHVEEPEQRRKGGLERSVQGE